MVIFEFLHDKVIKVKEALDIEDAPETDGEYSREEIAAIIIITVVIIFGVLRLL